MKLTLEKIYNLREPLAKLAKVPMSATAGYRIGSLFDTIKVEYDKIEVQRLKLAKQACKDAGEQDARTVPAAVMPEYLGKFFEFLKGEELEIPVRSISIETINGSIIPEDLMILIDSGVVAVPGD